MKNRLKWPGHILQMKDGRLPKIVFFGKLSRAKRKGGLPRLKWEMS